MFNIVCVAQIEFAIIISVPLAVCGLVFVQNNTNMDQTYNILLDQLEHIYLLNLYRRNTACLQQEFRMGKIKKR